MSATSATPPVFLILDIGPLSAATPREWLEFSRAGNCIIPQVVYEEMRFLFDRSPDPDLERLARAFNRFYPGSGWKISEATAAHDLLKSGAGQSLTKRNRISLAVAKCAYGMAMGFPNSLVVLISSDRSILQKVYDIQHPNFCAITGPALLQWCRTGQRPIAVSQKLQQLRSSGVTGMPLNSGLISQPATAAKSRVGGSSRTSTRTTTVKPVIREAASFPAVFSQIFSLATALALVVVAGFILNYIIRSANIRFGNPANQPPAQQAPQ